MQCLSKFGVLIRALIQRCHALPMELIFFPHFASNVGNTQSVH
jgi:hypothetical protein